MTHLTAMTAAYANDRLADWQTTLRAENKAPGTVAIYADAATRYVRWCTDRDHPPMSRAAVNTGSPGYSTSAPHPAPPASGSSPYAVSRPGSPPAARYTSPVPRRQGTPRRTPNGRAAYRPAMRRTAFDLHGGHVGLHTVLVGQRDEEVEPVIEARRNPDHLASRG